MGTITRSLAIILAIALLSLGFALDAATRSYRYRLDVDCGFYQFREPLTLLLSKGKHFDVEDDASGRMHRVAVIQDGKKISEQVFQYSGDRKLPDSYETYSNGERTGVVKIQFTDAGCIKRLDNFTLHNVLTGYITCTHSAGAVDQHRYEADGTERSRQILHYNDQGILLQAEEPSRRDTSATIVIDFDPDTGQETVRKQFDPELKVTTKCKYDPDGTLIRRESYDKHGRLYGFEDFSSGLPVKRTYNFSEDNLVEYRYSYDLKNWVNETKVYHNGKYVCSLTYERLSNGTAVRTTAKSPDGEVWADYPNQEVLNIGRTGKRPGGTNAVIYNQGQWW